MGVAGPLMAQVYGAQGLRHVVVSFDVLESRWPHHWSFQVFMVNALETLGLSEQVGAGERRLRIAQANRPRCRFRARAAWCAIKAKAVLLAWPWRAARAKVEPRWRGFEKVGRYDAAAESRTRVASALRSIGGQFARPLGKRFTLCRNTRSQQRSARGQHGRRRRGPPRGMAMVRVGGTGFAGPWNGGCTHGECGCEGVGVFYAKTQSRQDAKEGRGARSGRVI